MSNGEQKHKDDLHVAYQKLLQEGFDLVSVKDDHLRYADASQGLCDLFGFSDPSFVIGKTDFDILPQPFAEITYAEDMALLKGTQMDTSLFDIVLMKRSVIVDSDDQVIGISCIFEDISRSRLAYAPMHTNNYRIDVPPPPPIKMGGGFIARCEEGLPLLSASGGFCDLIGRRTGTGWIAPSDAASLLRQTKLKKQSAFPFFARLQQADGTIVFARLECTVTPSNRELVGAAYNLSGKLEADRVAQKLRTAKTIIERLSYAEFDLVSLIATQTGEGLILSRAGAVARTATQDHYNYQVEFEHYFRENIVASELEDCIRNMSLDAIKSALETKDQYMLSYSLYECGEIRRKKWIFSYLDEARDMILDMRSDITDAHTMLFDPLSGLYNRHSFRRMARKHLDSHPDQRFLFVRFSIDHFRTYSDLYGEDAGNLLLSSIKDLIRSLNIPNALCGHIEVEHFACIMPEAACNPDSMIQKVLAWLTAHNPDFDFAPKIAVYAIDDPNLDIAAMYNRALLALNSIQGKYGVYLADYTEEMRERILAEQAIVNEMGSALENGEFEPYFQPQYDYSTGKMVGAELLLRWNHPQRGLLLPKDFLPIFERNGFITQIDKYIWATACRYQRKWISKGMAVVPLSVNVSRADINDPDLGRSLMRIIDQYGLNPAHIRLEITETAYMKEPQNLIEVVRKLREMGFMVQTDDFGSGYSSLNMLRDVEVDALKLDMSYLHTLHTAPRGASILQSVIRMAQLLNLPVIAEGVETREQAEHLAQIGCVLMQGYYFAHPMPVAAFEELLSHVNSIDIS